MLTINAVIEALKRKRADLDDDIQKMEDLCPRIEGYLPGNGADSALKQQPSRTRNPKSETLAEAVLSHLIRTEEWPMRTKAILGKLTTQGFKVGGKKPLVTLYSALNRSPRFIKEKDGSWNIAPDRS